MTVRLTLFLDSLGAGGAQRQMLALAAGLDPAAFTVRLAWYNQTANFHPVPSGVEALPLPRAHRLDPQFVLALRRLVSRRHTDLVHAWLPAPSVYATALALLPDSAPVLTGVRCSPSLFAVDRTQGRMTVASSRLARLVTSNSQASLDWLEARGLPARKLRFVGNILGDALARRVPSTQAVRRALLAGLGLDPDVPPIVVLGRFDAYKNQDGLVRALILLKDRGIALPPVLMAGAQQDTARVAAVRRLAAQGGLTQLHIVPPVDDVATLLEAGRFSVLASHSEGTPNVVLEGLGLGTVVVATRVGEVPDLIRHGVTGLSCAPRDDAALAAVLAEALQMPPQRAEAMGTAARADMLARFGAARIIGQYADIYRETLERTA